jgi:hypothetical protein
MRLQSLFCSCSTTTQTACYRNIHTFMGNQLKKEVLTRIAELDIPPEQKGVYSSPLLLLLTTHAYFPPGNIASRVATEATETDYITMDALKQDDALKSFVLHRFGMHLRLLSSQFSLYVHTSYLMSGGIKSFGRFASGSLTHSIGPTTRNILEKEGLNVDGEHSNFQRGIVFGMDGTKPIVLKHILNDGMLFPCISHTHSDSI